MRRQGQSSGSAGDGGGYGGGMSGRVARHRFQLALVGFALGGAAGLASCVPFPDGKPSAPGRELNPDFRDTVKPLFETRCVWCHNHRKPLGGLNLQDRPTVFESGRRFLVPGDPEASLLYRAVTREGMHPAAMPGDGWGLTAAEGRALERWIAAGAPWPRGRAGSIRKKPYRVNNDDYL